MTIYVLRASRNPTPEEIRFGYGARHYSTFTLPRKRKPTKFKWVGNWWRVEEILSVSEKEKVK